MSVQVLSSAETVTVVPDGPEPGRAVVNPLEPAAGPDGNRFPLQSHASLVRALFLAMFDSCDPFPQVLSGALLRCYERAGWDLVTGEPADPGGRPAYPTLDDLEAAALSVADDAGYGREAGDVRGLMRDRIAAVRPGSGDESLFHAGARLIRLIEHLRLRQLPPGAKPGPTRPTAETFARLLAEILQADEESQPAAQRPCQASAISAIDGASAPLLRGGSMAPLHPL